MRQNIIAIRSLAFAAGIAFAMPAFAQAPAQPTCTAAGTWTYGGAGKGSTTAHPDQKATELQFTPDKKNKDVVPAFILTIDPGSAGTFQVNADFDVKHLATDGVFTLVGADSAIPGREFDVKVVKGDDGSSFFSRPITTAGKPFQVEFHSNGAVDMTVRNVKICKLR